MNRWKVIVGLIGLTAIVVFSNHLFSVTDEYVDNRRIAGFNLVAPPDEFSVDSLKNVKSTGAAWVSVVPYAFCDAQTAEITFDHPRQWWGEKPEGVSKTIKLAKSLGLKVMLKPHLWVGGQGWAGDLKFESDSLWEVFEKNYLDYIEVYAKIADSLDVEIYCVGTEIRNSTNDRNQFWINAIAKMRQEYSGKLTYAANWDEYDQISFWGELDYIGIDAYFPLSNSKIPSKEDLVTAWEMPIMKMEKVSNKFQKPVLFTEFGYQSTDYNTSGHWNISKDTVSVNFENQRIAFEALFESLRPIEWWRGGFIWKWHLNRNGLGRRNIKAYTPQNKPALRSIEHEFKHNF